MSESQSFWRELYDHIPGLLLVFRIDDNDQAQLIFANEQVHTQLGFTPEQFVLASESQSHVQKELEELVDEVADLSQRKINSSVRPFTLHDKMGNGRSFDYKYRLFKLKTSRSHFLLLQLEEAARESGAEQVTTETSGDTGSVMAAESELARAAVDQAYNLAAGDQNLLLRGEPGVGKLTLARRITAWAGHTSNSALIDYSGGASSSLEDLLRPDIRVLIIHHIASMPVEDQELLASLLSERSLRVIGTSSISLENALEKGRFSQDLYYQLAFQTILIPPLRKRRDDIEYLIRSWLQPVASKLGLGTVEPGEDQKNTLLEYNWPENFREFFNVMRYSLLQMKDEKDRFLVHLTTDETRQSSLFENGSPSSFITFDEMNRQYLQKVLKHTDGKIYGKDGAAAILGLKPTTLQSKLKKLNVR